MWNLHISSRGRASASGRTFVQIEHAALPHVAKATTLFIHFPLTLYPDLSFLLFLRKNVARYPKYGTITMYGVF